MDATANDLPRGLTPGRLALASGAFVWLLALVLRGRLHPDEIFQYLEPAHRLVYGYGTVTWEWHDGIRNWLAPGFIAGVLFALRALHVESPHAAIAVIWFFGALGHAAGMLALFRIIERRSHPRAAALGVVLATTWMPYAIYAPRTLADALTLPPLLGALLHTLRARDEGRSASGLCAGLLAGLAVALRYPSLVFGLPLGLSLVLARRWRALAAMALGTAIVVLGLGLLDRATWGDFLHSLRAYLAFNRPGGEAADKFGAEPWWWYLLPLGGGMPLLCLPSFVRGLKKPDVVAGCMALYLAILELQGHKESRFLLPLFPLGMCIAAGPLWDDLARLRARVRVPAWALALAWAATSVLSPTVQWRIGLDRALLDTVVAIGEDPDLRRLWRVDAVFLPDGGSVYLHRDVPRDLGDTRRHAAGTLADPTVSHVLILEQSSLPRAALTHAGFHVWRRDGEVEVWKRG